MWRKRKQRRLVHSSISQTFFLFSLFELFIVTSRKMWYSLQWFWLIKYGNTRKCLLKLCSRFVWENFFFPPNSFWAERGCKPGRPYGVTYVWSSLGPRPRVWVSVYSLRAKLETPTMRLFACIFQAAKIDEALSEYFGAAQAVSDQGAVKSSLKCLLTRKSVLLTSSMKLLSLCCFLNFHLVHFFRFSECVIWSFSSCPKMSPVWSRYDNQNEKRRERVRAHCLRFHSKNPNCEKHLGFHCARSSKSFQPWTKVIGQDC